MSGGLLSLAGHPGLPPTTSAAAMAAVAAAAAGAPGGLHALMRPGKKKLNFIYVRP